MPKNLLSYALIRSLYDEGRDYLDVFWPFAVRAMPESRDMLGLDSIQERLKGKFGIDVPLSVLGTIMNRAVKCRHVRREHWTYGLTDDGVAYLRSLDDEDVSRRLAALQLDAQEWLQSEGVSATEGQVGEALLSLLEENVESVVGFLDPSKRPGSFRFDRVPPLERQLVHYLQFAGRNRPEQAGTLEELVKGVCGSLCRPPLISVQSSQHQGSHFPCGAQRCRRERGSYDSGQGCRSGRIHP